MPNGVRVVHLTDRQRRELERRAEARDLTQRQVERAHIVLLAASGLPGREIARRIGCSEPTVVLWRRRFLEGGVAGLRERRGNSCPSESFRDGFDGVADGIAGS